MTEETLFAVALEKRTPVERAAFLEEACGADVALRRRIEALLKSHSQAGSFLEPARTRGVDTIDEPGCERPGSVIGSYKLLEQIGEGGFGFVYMAEQTHPVRRKVALKILKPGMDTRQVVARFEAERQALALMDHPNIAHVFDGGQTDAGRPYFVMELVRGIAITDFCDRNHLSVRQRLELFVDVCHAVQHAHQKGIIHRDLKPGNVLVTMHDDKAVVKVIDFGIAKATGQQLTDKTLFTNFAQLIGTPLYMSPEQAQMSGLDIDTRSDIYALGVLLYELLTGTTPFDRERLQTVGYDEMRRIIREEEPPKPSTRFSTLGQAGHTLSANRGSDPRRLGQLYRGELDWIAMKALEKDRNRRYESASAFAADVLHYLHDEPVIACPPSGWYRFGKFARRYRVAMLVGAAMTLTILLAGGVSIWLAIRAINAEQSERRKHEQLDEARAGRVRQQTQINRELTAALVKVAELRQQVSNRKPGEVDLYPQLRAALRRAETLAESELADAALVQQVRVLIAAQGQEEKDRRMIARLEDIRLNKGSFGSSQLYTVSGGSREAYEKAFKEYGLPIFEMRAEEAARRIAASAISEWLVAALDDCATNDGELCQQLLPIAQRIYPDGWRGRYYQARSRRDFKKLKELATEPEALQQLPGTLYMFGMMLWPNEVTAGVAFLREAQRRHPNDLWLNLLLADAVTNLPAKTPEDTLRNEAEAVAFTRVAVAARPNSPALLNRLAESLLGVNHFDEVIAVSRQSLTLEPNNPWAYSHLGSALDAKGDEKGADEAHRQAAMMAPNSADLVAAHARVLLRKGKLVEALDAYRKAVALDSDSYVAANGLGETLEAMKDYNGAIASYRNASKLYPTHPTPYRSLGRCLEKIGDREAAIAVYRKSLEYRTGDGEVHLSLGQLLFAKGEVDAAITSYQAAIKEQVGDRAYLALGLAQRSKGNLRAAIEAFDEATGMENENGFNWQCLAWAWLASGDRREYQKNCAQMYYWLRHTKEPATARYVLRTCLATPDAMFDMSRLIPLAELAANDKANLGLLAAAHYRVGKHQEASKKFDEAGKHGPLSAWDNLFLAMTQHRLGQAAKAKATFDQAIQKIGKANYTWPESDEMKQLRQEAETLLKGTERKVAP